MTPDDLIVEDGTGLATANTYATVEDADAYHAARLHCRNWLDEFQPGDKATALVWATRLLDEQVRWKGDRIATTQALEWPRANVLSRDQDTVVGANLIPQWLKNATAEFARNLVEKDRTREVETQRVTSRTAGGKSATFGAKDRAHLAVIPAAVMSMIQPYTIHGVVRLVRC